MDAFAQRRLIALARIGKPHGLRGEVKIRILGRTPEVIGEARRVFVGPTQLDARLMKVEGLRGGAGRTILKLAGVRGPEEARALAGSLVFLQRRDFAEAPDGEFYWVDLIGLRVLADGEELGKVSEIAETPAYDVLIVRGDGAEAEERLVPFTRAALREVRQAEGVILVNPAAAWEAEGGEPETDRREAGMTVDGETKHSPGRRKKTRRKDADR